MAATLPARTVHRARIPAIILMVGAALLYFAPQLWSDYFTVRETEFRATSNTYARRDWTFLNTTSPISAGTRVFGNVTMTGFQPGLSTPQPTLFVLTFDQFATWNPDILPPNPVYQTQHYVYDSAAQKYTVRFDFVAPSSSVYYFVYSSGSPKAFLYLGVPRLAPLSWPASLSYFVGFMAFLLSLPVQTAAILRWFGTRILGLPEEEGEQEPTTF